MVDATSRAGALTRRGLLAGSVMGALLPGTGRAAGMNPRLSLADPGQFTLQSPEKIQRRFDLYKQIGVGTLRVSIGWWDLEPAENAWRGATNLPYLKQAARNGFRLKMNLAMLSEPPAWFMQKHSDARLFNRAHVTSPSDMSYWYSGLRPTMAATADRLFGYLARQNLFEVIDYVFVDCGPAAEPIYPADWTLGPQSAGQPSSFWFYDRGAQADFGPKMRAAYGGVLDNANRAWGTSFARWEEVRIPEVGMHPGAMWNDVLVWYRDTKRDFVRWQIANYHAQLARHAGSRPPRLLLMIPGSHIPPSEWQEAVRDGSGNSGIKVMLDSEYLVDTAIATGCWLQYTGADNEPEDGYLRRYLKSKAAAVPMWAENSGDPSIASKPQQIADAIAKNAFYGFEYINARYVFGDDDVTPNPRFGQLAEAYASVAKRL